VAVIALLTSLALIAAPHVEAGGYRYVFDVGVDGDANVTITFTSKEPGSSWLLVPRGFTPWDLRVDDGYIVSDELSEAKPTSYVFYLNYSFTYSTGPDGFKAEITYRTRYVAFIEEPRGFFYSTQVSSCPSDELEVDVYLPPGSSKSVTIYGASNYLVEESNGRVVIKVFDRPKYGRLAIEFSLPNTTPNLTVVSNHHFHVKAASRYLDLAEKVLDVYVKAYPTLTELFGIELDDVEVRLYVPDINDVMSGVGGYVPFKAGKLGEINLNMFYIRAVEGSFELIALHELVHHFLWRVGIPPDRLWVHEGLAEYLSIEVAKLLKLGRGVDDHEEMLLQVALNLDNLGFVQGWDFSTVGDLTPYYAASYYVFRSLGDDYGGLNYYRMFFSYVKSRGGVEIDEEVIACLSLAANESLTYRFKGWGFELGGLKVERVETLVKNLPSWCQSAKLLAKLLLEAAKVAEEWVDRGRSKALLEAAAYITEHAELISVAVYALIALTLTWSLRRLVDLKRRS